MYKPDQDVDWNALVLSIHNSECILMIGPDAITESIGGRPVSIMQLFSEELINQLPPDDHLKSAYLTPAQVAQVFKHRKDSWALRSTAQEFFGRRIDSTTPFLKALATLPFRLVIDTTPLRQMELAFFDAGKPFIEEWYHKKGQVRKIEGKFDDKRPLVYHIFGSMKDIKSLVLAENDFVDLIVSVTSGNPPLPTELLNTFTSECSMLFLGFGVRHLLLRILLHVLNSGKSMNRSFAIERFNDDLGDRAVEGVKLLFQHGQRIDFIDIGLDRFTDQLCNRYRTCLESLPSPECIEKEAKEPLVFISYRHENAIHADQLRKRLKELGIKVWRDVDNLRAGENWDQTIKQVIDRVDYFMLLLTKALFETWEGYVIKEINFALNRQIGRMGTFIVPVWIDDYRPEDDDKIWSLIKPFTTIDVRIQSNLEKLATEIKRDLETKKKTVR